MNLSAMPQAPPHIDLDLTGTFCPMAFVKLRLFADTLPEGATFTALYEATAANEPLVRSIKALGHIIVGETIVDDDETTKKHSSNSGAPLVLIEVKIHNDMN